MRIISQFYRNSARWQVRILAATLSLWLAGPGFAFQQEHPVSGRVIAPVMGAAGADWLDRPERASEEHPDEAIDALHLKPGMTVADIGAGTGYMTLRMARRVGPGGKVYAVDIQPEMLRRLRANAARANLTNIQTVLGDDTDPKLPRGQIDLILLVDVYHELSHPQEMVRHFYDALAPDGRLVLVEYRKEDPSVPIKPLHKMSVQQVKLELEAQGFHLRKVDERLPWQHILILTK
jgi:SAM-dependent methyltransferase